MQKVIHSILTIGIDNQKGFLVSIETVTHRGIFQFEIIGLANKTISESKQRILSAIDYSLPEKKQYIHKRIVTLLSPAGIKKEGSHFDLPIAISYIISDKDSIQPLFDRVIILGELTLTGAVLYVKNINTLIAEGVRNGIHNFIIPQSNSIELIREDIYLWKVQNISEIIEVIKMGKEALKQKGVLFEQNLCIRNIEKETRDNTNRTANFTYLIDSIKETDILKRALLISLAGKHNLLLIGEPGTGKSLIAKSARELLPSIEVSDLNEIQIENLIESKKFEDNRITKDDSLNAPFREPHHTSSYSEIIGNKHIPGEIVLANKGVLFFDEMSEINKRVLEGLRQPLEDTYIQINQQGFIETDFILIGSMNPCDCGFYKSINKKCVCARSQIDKFQRKISSPLFQRFDLTINTTTAGNYIHSNSSEDLKGNIMFENILRVRKIHRDQIEKGRIKMGQIDTKHTQIESEKYENKYSENKKSNSVTQARQFLLIQDSQNESSLSTKEKDLLLDIRKRFYFSKRELSSLLRVARTIADIEGDTLIKEVHIHEALSFKNKNA